jgi:perosamine synthetase
MSRFIASKFKIRISEPKLGRLEKKFVNECLNSTWISSRGKYIDMFEEEFANKVGSRHAIAVNNGTSALHLANLSLGMNSQHSALVPNLTYIATANSVSYVGAKPVFTDVSPNDMNMDKTTLEACDAQYIDPRLFAIIPVHLYGKAANMKDILQFASARGLVVIEDAAESIGATHDGQQVGTFGDFGMFSFFGNKIITTGEGGMLTTNNEELAERAKYLRGQAMDPHRQFWFDEIGHNFRMTNIQAAIGLAQLRSLDKKLATRRRIVSEYLFWLSDEPRIHVYTSPDQGEAPWLFNIALEDEGVRKTVQETLEVAGIETRPIFPPITYQKPYLEGKTYPVSDFIHKTGISLPLHENLKTKDVRQISRTLLDVVGRASIQ